MKKRILALALAATTAFSMFGSALSVSAVDRWVDNQNYMKPADQLVFNYTAATEDEEAYVQIYKGTNSAANEIQLSDIVFVSEVEDAVGYEVDADTVFVYDYFNDDARTWDKLQVAYDNGDVISFAELLKGSALTKGDNTVSLRKSSGASVYSFRKELEDAFNTFVGGMVSKTDIKAETDELNVRKLIDNINSAKANIANMASSQLVAYMQAYNEYIQYADLPDINAQIEAVQAKIDALAMRGEDEFKTATAYKYFVADLEELQDKLFEADTYSKVKTVDSAVELLSTKYDSKGADKNELKDLLLSLFDGLSITQIRNLTAYPITTKDEDLATNKAVYDSRDYDTAAGKPWDKFNTAFVNAVEMYKRVNSKSFQSDVNNMVAELENAISNLSATTSVPNWLLVKIEEDLAKAYALVETDYTKASWANLEKAMAKAESVLDSENPGYSTANAAAKALEDALKDGTLKIQSVTTSEKSALKKAIEAAEKTLKGLDKTSNGAQYYALTAAINEAKALYNNNTVADGLKANTLRSKVAAAIDTLNAAIDFSEVVMGWSQLANGTWMYGTADGYITSDWAWIGGAWYYFDANGIMATGWLQLDGAWYYMYSWGGMAKGWALVNGTWYYLNPNGGKMLANGWNWIDGKCYYFYSWGGMAANTTIDGYKVDASGAWVQ